MRTLPLLSVIEPDTQARKRGELGFTLMEMVIAVLVVAVMIAVVTPHLLGVSQHAKATACEQNERMIRSALQAYYTEYNTFPSGTTDAQLQTLVTAQFLDSVPKEPSGGTYSITDDPADPTNVTVTCSIHGTFSNDANSTT